LRARLSPNFDAACFHAQQSAEKYIKSFLQEKSIDIPKTHKLIELMVLCKESLPDIQSFYSELLILEDYAVMFRYPGQTASREEAKNAVKVALKIQIFIQNVLDISRK
jgi:HEPN domain-containing protein